MLNLGRHSLLTIAFLSLVTGCASIQSDASLNVLLPQGEPLQEEALQEEALQELIIQDETLRIPEDVEAPRAKIDYIDDRINPSVDDAIDEEIEDTINERLDERIDERLDERLVPSRAPIRQISFLAAYRDFTDSDLWDRVDAETALGIDYAHEVSNGLGFELGTMGSLGTKSGETGNIDVTGASVELYGGARYFFRNDSRWLPYVGGGLSGILAGVDNDQGGQVADDQDFTLGIYLRGGVQYQFNRVMFLGVDLRTLLGTDLELETITGDADYIQLGLGLGFRL